MLKMNDKDIKKKDKGNIIKVVDRTADVAKVVVGAAATGAVFVVKVAPEIAKQAPKVAKNAPKVIKEGAKIISHFV